MSETVDPGLHASIARDIYFTHRGGPSQPKTTTSSGLPLRSDPNMLWTRAFRPIHDPRTVPARSSTSSAAVHAPPRRFSTAPRRLSTRREALRIISNIRSNKPARSATRHLAPMDDQRVGALLRVLRIRRGLRQIDVAQLAGVSDVTVSRIERGHLESLSVASVRRIARVLEARIELNLWTRAGAVERLISAHHAALVEAVIATLVGLGWNARPEVSFNFRGERGLVDIVAWHAETRTLLLIEVKTEVVDVGELFGTFDRKRRLAPELARAAGLDPATISTALVVADTATNHRRIRAHAATFGAALPDGGQRFRSFIRRPAGSIQAVAFWAYPTPRDDKSSRSGCDARSAARIDPGAGPPSGS